MAKKTAKPSPAFMLTDQRLVDRLAETIFGALATRAPPLSHDLAATLVDRIRTHYHLGGKEPCSKPSESPS